MNMKEKGFFRRTNTHRTVTNRQNYSQRCLLSLLVWSRDYMESVTQATRAKCY